jgi:hypothetical protein
MKTKSPEPAEAVDRLIRAVADRRGFPLEMCVQYQKSVIRECAVYRIMALEYVKG